MNIEGEIEIAAFEACERQVELRIELSNRVQLDREFAPIPARQLGQAIVCEQEGPLLCLAEVVERFATFVPRMAVTGCLWVFFPSQAVDATTATEDFVRLAALEMGLVDVKRLDLDPAWVALKFQLKSRSPRPESKTRRPSRWPPC